MRFLLKTLDFEVVGFYPYTSHVIHAIVSQSRNYKLKDHEIIEEFGNRVLKAAIAKGCVHDNKIVIEIKPKAACAAEIIVCSNIFVGYYDNLWSIGFGVAQYDKWTKEHNQRFDV